MEKQPGNAGFVIYFIYFMGKRGTICFIGTVGSVVSIHGLSNPLLN
jgi:hypothetical protein